MFSTTRPSFTAEGGTCTPGTPASTRICGVSWLSLIHSTRARSRYGRWLVMWKKSSVMREVYAHGAPVGAHRGTPVGVQTGTAAIA